MSKDWSTIELRTPARARHERGKRPLVGSTRWGHASRRARGESGTAWLLIAPALVVLVAMTLAAGIYVFWVSFFRVGSFGTPTVFVGWSNYASAFSAFNFLPDIIHT